MELFNMHKLRDGGSLPSKLINLYTQYGMYKGHELYKLILELIQTKTGSSAPEKITFADLERLGYKRLHIVATKLYTLNGQPTGKRKIFSVEKTPNTQHRCSDPGFLFRTFLFSAGQVKKSCQRRIHP